MAADVAAASVRARVAAGAGAGIESRGGEVAKGGDGRAGAAHASGQRVTARERRDVVIAGGGTYAAAWWRSGVQAWRALLAVCALCASCKCEEAKSERCGGTAERRCVPAIFREDVIEPHKAYHN